MLFAEIGRLGRQGMISEDEIERALCYLRDEAPRDAQARANRLYLEQFLKTVLAQEQTKLTGMSATAAEAMARTSQPYLDVLQAYKETVQEDERRRFLRSAAEAKIEVWRSQEASNRMVDRLHR